MFQNLRYGGAAARTTRTTVAVPVHTIPPPALAALGPYFSECRQCGGRAHISRAKIVNHVSFSLAPTRFVSFVVLQPSK